MDQLSPAILYCPTNPTALHNMISLARIFDDDVDHVYIIPEQITVENIEHLITKKNYYFYFLNGENDHSKVGRSVFIFFLRGLVKKSPILHNIVSFLKTGLERSVLKKYAIKAIRNKITRYQLRINNIINEHDFHSAIFYDDRSEVWSLVALKLCRERKIKTIVPAFAHTAGPRELMYLRKNKREYIFDKFDANMNITKLYSYEGRYYTYYPRIMLLAASNLNLLSENPWVIGGGNSDYVLVQGYDQRARHIQLGCAPDKLIITGLPEFDDLFNARKNIKKLREEVVRSHSVSSPVVVVSLPQLGEHGILPWKQHWKEIEYLCEVLRKNGVRAYLSLHPKMKREDYEYLEQYGHILGKRKLSTILPIADLFIATFSSTVVWAKLLEIETVIVDFYNLNYTHWNEINGVTVVSEKRFFESNLMEFFENFVCTDPNFRKEPLEVVGDNVVFDGKCGIRMKNFILEKNMTGGSVW